MKALDIGVYYIIVEWFLLPRWRVHVTVSNYATTSQSVLKSISVLLVIIFFIALFLFQSSSNLLFNKMSIIHIVLFEFKLDATLEEVKNVSYIINS